MEVLAAASRTEKRGRGSARWLHSRAAGTDQSPTLIEVAVTTAIGEEAVGANAHEARREHVEKESSQELVGCERERAGASLMTVVLIAEGDAVGSGVQ